MLRFREVVRGDVYWVLLFLVLLILSTWPFILIGNRPVLVGGIPLLFLYAVVVWVIGFSLVVGSLYALREGG